MLLEKTDAVDSPGLNTFPRQSIIPLTGRRQKQ